MDPEIVNPGQFGFISYQSLLDSRIYSIGQEKNSQYKIKKSKWWHL